MKTAQWMCVATSLAASALQLACGEDSTALGPNGGTSGSWSGAAGSAGAGQGAAAGDGGAAGTTEQAGAAGQSGAGGAPAAARFQVLLEGERLRVVPLDTVSFMACDSKIHAIQRVNGGWSILRDERTVNGYYFVPHYLDGVLDPQCLMIGCDATRCEQMSADPMYAFGEMMPSTREYVQVGLRAAPLCEELDAESEDAGLDAGLDAGGRQVADIESRVPSGTLGMRVRYFLGGDCSGPELTADVAVSAE